MTDEEEFIKSVKEFETRSKKIASFEVRAMQTYIKGCKDAKCRKCGDLGAVPVLKPVPCERTLSKDKPAVRWIEYYFAVMECECIRLRRCFTTERADEKEMKKIFK